MAQENDIVSDRHEGSGSHPYLLLLLLLLVVPRTGATETSSLQSRGTPRGRGTTSPPGRPSALLCCRHGASFRRRRRRAEASWNPRPRGPPSPSVGTGERSAVGPPTPRHIARLLIALLLPYGCVTQRLSHTASDRDYILYVFTHLDCFV